MLDLSVIVCTHGRPAALARFLPPLAEAANACGLSTELMVIDDGSEPPVTAPCVVLRQPHLGAAAARNTGARTAVGAWLLFCDDDLEISAETINALWSARGLSRCVVPEVRGSRGELQNAYTVVWRRWDVKFDQHSSPMPEVAFPMGACFLVERDAYWEAGGCDERFFPTYYDDTMLGHALGRIGVRVRMTEALATHHQHGGGPVTSGINRAIYTNRWLYVALALSGPRRALALALGLPRTLTESVRKQTAAPFIGYLNGVTKAVRG
jgi:GT2 family glycosyltransferase